MALLSRLSRVALPQKIKVLLLSFTILLAAENLFAQGGPPLVTDDPGTPGNANWEINSAAQWTSAEESSTLQFPLLDVNYGYGERIQLNLNTGLINFNQHGSHATSGLSVASVGVKWRFIDEDRAGVAISTYPRVDFHHRFSSDDPTLNSPGNRYFLPLEFSKEIGRLGLNPEIGYASYTQFESEWVYGLAISYSFAKEKEALFELHGRSSVVSSNREILYNFGTRYLLAENISFIGSFGRTFQIYSDESTSWSIYAGVQIRL